MNGIVGASLYLDGVVAVTAAGGEVVNMDVVIVDVDPAAAADVDAPAISGCIICAARLKSRKILP